MTNCWQAVEYQKSKKSLLTVIAVLLSTLMACSLSIRPSVKLGSVEVTQLSTSYGIDIENGGPIDSSSVFPTTTERIYVSYHLKASQEIPLTILWYRENHVVLTQEGEHQGGWVYSWAEPGPHGQFRAGNYRIEVRFGASIIAETEFIVEGTASSG